MSKARKKTDPLAKRPDENDLQWLLRLARRRETQAETERGKVTPEAEKHGCYEDEFVTHVETGTKARAVINRGGSPVCRWKAARRLSDTQLVAINYVTRLWELSCRMPHLTASYGERVPGGGDAERNAGREIDARNKLHEIQGYIPRTYWNVFEAVVRFDEPAGVAGSILANSSRNAKHTAFLAVCFVADCVAMKERL